MYDLTHFALSDMTACGAALRKLGDRAATMEETADRIVRYLCDHLRAGPGGDRACALVRLFKTHNYGDLDPHLQAVARRLLGPQAPPPDLQCLVLLATAGDRPEWNSRRESAGHQAIPLGSPEMLARMPMIAQLVEQFGLQARDLFPPEPNLLVDLEQKTYNVFHVPRAPGSPFVPAQREFVTPYGIQSVLGFGGLLPGAELFAVILFSRVAITRDTADLFKALALSAKLALLGFAPGAVFGRGEALAAPGMRL